MARIRFRLRTLMLIIAFVAIILALAIQGLLLRKAMMREREALALAAWHRALAEKAAAQAVQAISKAEENRGKMEEPLQEWSQPGADDGTRR